MRNTIPRALHVDVLECTNPQAEFQSLRALQHLGLALTDHPEWAQDDGKVIDVPELPEPIEFVVKWRWLHEGGCHTLRIGAFFFERSLWYLPVAWPIDVALLY